MTGAITGCVGGAEPGPTRVFRAGSAPDLICAALTASQLPAGNDVLAYSLDKSQADVEEYRRCFLGLVGLHDWKGVVDISGPALVAQWREMRSIADRWRRMQETRRSMAQLRQWLAPAFNLEPTSRPLDIALDRAVQEIYINVPNHSDVQTFCKVFPSASICYFPHTFDSLTQVEISYLAPCCDPARNERSFRLADTVKRALFGTDVVPLRHVPFQRAYTFKNDLPWATQSIKLDHVLTPEHMTTLFSKLPADVQSFYRGLADECRAATGVLLMNPDIFAPEDHPYDREVEGYLLLAGRLLEAGAETILIKPHTRSSKEWAARVIGRVREVYPGAHVLPVERHYSFPIEVTLCCFRPTACAGIGSTCLRTLRMIYGITSYCPESLLLSLGPANPTKHREYYRAVKTWVDEYRADYVSV